MRHLVVVAHPSESSFTMALASTYAAEVENLGHEHKIFDLYRAGFNPILTASELAGINPNHPPSADVKRAQEDVGRADVLTAIYPLWWLSMPAIMKGYIDRVFARGFAYQSEAGIVHGLLSGKRCILITISGAPLPVLVGTGGWNAVMALQDTHIFRSAGFDLLEHVHFDEIRPSLPKSTYDAHIARVRACARRHFKCESTNSDGVVA